MSQDRIYESRNCVMMDGKLRKACLMKRSKSYEIYYF